MSETRTRFAYLLVINTCPVPLPAKLVQGHIYSDGQLGLEYTANLGREVTSSQKPLDVIMREVDWQLDRHPKITGVYLIGDFHDEVFESLCREIARRTHLPVWALRSDELLAGA